MRMFPFTLAEDINELFYSFATDSITTWEEMEMTFLNEYFPEFVFLRKRTMSSTSNKRKMNH